MSEPGHPTQWQAVHAAWYALDYRVKVAAALALAVSVVAIALPLERSTFATGPSVLSGVAFGQWAVALAGRARLLVADARPGQPDATAAELARGRAPVIVALACALPGWLSLCWHGGVSVGVLALGVVALEIAVLRYLRRAVAR